MIYANSPVDCTIVDVTSACLSSSADDKLRIYYAEFIHRLVIDPQTMGLAVLLFSYRRCDDITPYYSLIIHLLIHVSSDIRARIAPRNDRIFAGAELHGAHGRVAVISLRILIQRSIKCPSAIFPAACELPPRPLTTTINQFCRPIE